MDWGNCTFGTDKVATISCLPVLVSTLIHAALVFAGTVALFFIIYAGYKYMRSAGDPKQVDGARKTLTWAVIGLILILLSFFIVNTISDITGATCIKKFGFDNCAVPTPTP